MFYFNSHGCFSRGTIVLLLINLLFSLLLDLLEILTSFLLLQPLLFTKILKIVLVSIIILSCLMVLFIIADHRNVTLKNIAFLIINIITEESREQ